MKNNLLKIVLVFSFCLGLNNNSFSQEKTKFYIDTLDNRIDLSNYLYNLHGFLPIPMIITEPAVGYGGGLTAAFFIPKKTNSDEKRFSMPDVLGLVGGYTESQTWFTGLGYFGFWNDDRIRYRGIAAYYDAKLSYYGNGNDFLSKNPFKFNITGTTFIQQAIFRIGNSNFLLGGKYHYYNSDVTFFRESILPEYSISYVTSGIGLIAEYENYNNYFSPSAGFRANLTFDQNAEVLGGDYNGGRLSAYAIHYLPINEYWSSGLRFESILATGDNPFFALPFISLRGVAAMRYQGELTALIETEQQFFIDSRWSVLAFAGYGSTFNLDNELKKGSSAWNAGAGFRYLLARLIGMRVGIDVARGPEDWAFYITAGSAWSR